MRVYHFGWLTLPCLLAALAVPVSGQQQPRVELTWQQPNLSPTPVENVWVLRQLEGGSFTRITTVPGAATRFEYTTNEVNKQHCYYVVNQATVNGQITTSEPSNTVCVLVGGTTPPPPTPTVGAPSNLNVIVK